MGVEFPESCKDWQTTPIEDLYHVPLLRQPIETSIPVYKNLEHYSKKCDHLVIWTDCDREGEAIGYDIIDVCKKSAPKIDVYRAKFSALTREDLENAALNLERPNQWLADAVKVRQEIDLRIGASFTRFQTLTLRDFSKKGLGVISYGPCQFPTLGFIVERH
jgi:DNA topoisomerase III